MTITKEMISLAHQDDDKLANIGDLRVWWIPQLGCGSTFIRRVRSVAEGVALMDTLASYDAFQLVHRVKGDYCNAGGLSVYDGYDWCDWYDDETGEDDPRQYLEDQKAKFFATHPEEID